MRKLMSIWIVAVCFPAAVFSQQVDETWTFRVGDLSRTSIVYVPSGTNEPPLLISMHGMGIPASWNREMMKFESIAERDKFIVVYPEAAPGSNLRWDLSGTKDIEFIEAIIDSMSQRFSIDRNRVYASGFSMGGMMSYYLACKIPEKIAAIAPGCGYPLGGQSGCTRTRPVPIFHIHGTADDFVAYGNLHNFLNTKIQEYGCPQIAQRTEPYPSSDPNSQSFKEYWGPCVDDNGMQSEITLISVTGMIHDWATPGKANANEDPEFNGKPFDVNGSEEAWAYLKTQSLNGSGYRLDVSTRGRGLVTRNPEEESYEKGAQVTLTADAFDGWVFDSWSGDLSGSQNPLTVTMDGLKSVTANFLTENGKEDLVVNGTFSSGTDFWTFNKWDGEGSGRVVDGEYQLVVDAVGNNHYDIQVVQPGIKLEQGKTYRLMYEAYASSNRVLNVNIGMPEEPWTTFLSSISAGESEIALTTSRQTFILDFTMQESTYENSRVEFSAASETPSVYIDNVSLFEIEPSVASVPGLNRTLKRMSIHQKGSSIEIITNANSNKELLVEMYDLRGSVVRSAEFKTASWGHTQRYSFNTAGIPKGYYMIKVRIGNSVKESELLLTGR